MKIRIKMFIFLLFCLVLLSGQSTGAVLKASQCFKSLGIPKVAFACNPDNMINIHRAFHGMPLKPRTRYQQVDPSCTPSPGHVATNCTFCKSDCIDNSMNAIYDWSTCMGNTSCIKTVMQSYMPKCEDTYSFQENHFSTYLQVEYSCIPKSQVIDVCSTINEKWVTEGYLTSPNYPQHYHTNANCMCELTTDYSSKIRITLYELLLETRNSSCKADWLMVRQDGLKHRHCGALSISKNITSMKNELSLQFHSDGRDVKVQNFNDFDKTLKGFFLYFRAVPETGLKVTCKQLDYSHPWVKEITEDDVVPKSPGSSVPEHNTQRPRSTGPDNDSWTRRGGGPNDIDYTPRETVSSPPTGNRIRPTKHPRTKRPGSGDNQHEGRFGKEDQDNGSTRQHLQFLPLLTVILCLLGH